MTVRELVQELSAAGSPDDEVVFRFSMDMYEDHSDICRVGKDGRVVVEVDP